MSDKKTTDQSTQATPDSSQEPGVSAPEAATLADVSAFLDRLDAFLTEEEGKVAGELTIVTQRHHLLINQLRAIVGNLRTQV